MKGLVTRILGAVAAPPPAAAQFEGACPTEIRQTVPGHGRFASMASIHAAMLQCTNITTLQVRSTLLGCSEWPDRFSFPFDQHGGERYASAPQVLSLEGYRANDIEYEYCRRRSSSFTDALWFWTSLGTLRYCARYLSLPEAQRNKTNLDLWLDAMDFSKIHTLHLNDSGSPNILSEQAVQKLPPKLTSLESLTVHDAIAEEFILALLKGSLRYLSWQNPEAGPESDEQCGSRDVLSLQPVLWHQGPNLLSLEYHSDERDSRAPPTLSTAELRSLVTLAPRLAALTIDLARQPNNASDGGSDWPWEQLQLLAEGLPQLTELTVYFELGSECHRKNYDNRWGMRWPRNAEGGCTGPQEYAHPLLNETSAAEMARFLWQHKTGEPLRKVSFKAGDWAAPWDGPLYSPGWLEGRRAWATCKEEDRGSSGQKQVSGASGTEGNIVCESDNELPWEESLDDDGRVEWEEIWFKDPDAEIQVDV